MRAWRISGMAAGLILAIEFTAFSYPPTPVMPTLRNVKRFRGGLVFEARRLVPPNAGDAHTRVEGVGCRGFRV